MDYQAGPGVPVVEVVDLGVYCHAVNLEGLTTAQAAQAYAEMSANKAERAIQIRQISDSIVEGWIPVTINAPPPAPLTELAWNQGGWPSWNGVDYVVVLDGDTSFHALDPEVWTLERAVQDYWSSYACEIKEPHEVSIKRYSSAGFTEPVTYTIPLEEPAP